MRSFRSSGAPPQRFRLRVRARGGKMLDGLPLPARFQHLALPGRDAGVGLRSGARPGRFPVFSGLRWKRGLRTRPINHLHEALDIGVPAEVAQLERIASRQRLEVGRQILRRRHGRPPHERRNHKDVLVDRGVTKARYAGPGTSFIVSAGPVDALRWDGWLTMLTLSIAPETMETVLPEPFTKRPVELVGIRAGASTPF
jgi:hypothetical protein